MRSASEAIPAHIRLLNFHAELLTETYNVGSITASADGLRDFNALSQANVLIEVDEGQYRMSRYLKRHLDMIMRRRRNYDVGENLKGQIESLENLAKAFERAAHEGQAALQAEFIEDFENTVFEISQDLEATMTQLRALVDSEFGDVTSFSEKAHQNDHYLKRIEQSLDTFALIEDAPIAHLLRDNALLSDHERVYRRQLRDKLSGWRIAFMEIADVLRQHVHALRRVEPKARLLRRLAFHLQRDRSYEPPNAPDENQELPDWMRLTSPNSIISHPQVTDSAQEDILRQIASTIPAETIRSRQARGAGSLADEPIENQEVDLPLPVWRQSFNAMLLQADQEPVSALEWFRATNLEISPDVWLIYVYATSTAQEEWPYGLEVIIQPVEPIEGIVWLNDVVICRRR